MTHVRASHLIDTAFVRVFVDPVSFLYKTVKYKTVTYKTVKARFCIKQSSIRQSHIRQ